MKNRQWNKLTTDKCKQFCNNWCCPCNDGSTGCYANDFFENLCENSSLAYIHRGEEDKFDKLQEESYKRMVESYDNPEIYEEFCVRFVDELCEKHEEKPKNCWELLVKSYENDMKKLEEVYSLDSEEDIEQMPICNDENAAMPYETPKVNCKVDGMIPIEWIRKYTNHRTVEFGDMWVFINCMINDWEKEK